MRPRCPSRARRCVRAATALALVLGAHACSLRSLSRYSDGERPAPDATAEDGGEDSDTDASVDAAGDSPAADARIEADAPVDALDGLPPGLVYYFRFDGNTLDSSGNGNDGVLSGNANVSAVGVSGTSLGCTGINPDRFVFGSGFKPGTGSFSVALHARLGLSDASAPPQYGTLISKGTQWNNAAFQFPGFGFGYRFDQDFVVAVVRDEIDGGRFTPAIWSATGFGDGAFHHLVMVVDRPARKLRVYGGGTFRAEKGLDPTFGSIDSPSDGWLCAGPDPATSSFRGALDEVMIFSRALTDTEVAALAARF